MGRGLRLKNTFLGGAQKTDRIQGFLSKNMSLDGQQSLAVGSRLGLAGLFGGSYGWPIAGRSSLDGGRGGAADRAAPLRDEGAGDRAPAQAIAWRRLRADQRVEESVRAGIIATNRAVGLLSR
jgi:hypothetical protein